LLPSRQAKFPVVGLGASAGGIQALESFFKGVVDERMAFVIVTHLSPSRASHLHEVVRRYTAMPVQIAQDDVALEPGHVYVMPENVVLTVEGGRLQTSQPGGLHRERKPVDIFFSALARDQRDYAVGIVLSGGDGDGTLGVKAIKESGGLTLAQASDGSGPRHPEMPKSAMASGLVDFAVRAEDMGARLALFARSFALLDGLVKGKGGTEHEHVEARQAIYAVLRNRAGHDFSGYKTKTFMRRVQRRMQVLHLEGLPAYLERLQSDPAEVGSLFRDLLINVTSFFRDEDAFDALQKLVIPRLLDGKGAGDTIRVWIPGCATGEEVFSVAILIREQLDGHSSKPRVQIFATDIDEPAIAVARSARYPAALLDTVSAERRDRFFVRDGASYVLTREVREMCIFSPHSVIRDPPFSRMDMVSCRNLLIYFGPQIQAQAIPTFHYALRPGGFLFLGTSENIGQYGSLFQPLDRKHRIFQRCDNAVAPIRLPASIRQARGAVSGGEPDERSISRGAIALRQAAEAMVLERFAPAHVLVDAAADVLFYSAGTGKYLEPPQGAPNPQLVAMARKGLRLELRNALREAREFNRPVVRGNIAFEVAGDRVQVVTITVQPMAGRNDGEPLFLVVFNDVSASADQKQAASIRDADPDATTADLERQLRDTREVLQSTIEEYETALEELKAANEELMSVNEEAQSGNEELEASKEEMQSLNEELTTINSELNQKVEEVDRAHSDLKNLFESTQIATVFLDRNLVIRAFTPAASAFFNLIPSDAGRPLTDLSGHLAYPELKGHIRRVFETGEVVEQRLLQDEQRSHFLARLLPYRDTDGRIQGVVATFIDVTRLTEAEQQQTVLISELNHRVKNMLAVVIAIAERTSMTNDSKEAYRDALVGRLRSMARSYELLARHNWTEASVVDLVEQELKPFGLEQFKIEGGDIALRPRAGLSLGMILHELVTNAAKHGALSVPDGSVGVSWSVKPGGVTSLRWREHGGPPVIEPQRRGFGLQLVEREVRYNLKGDVTIAFEPAGLALELTFLAAG
jgi:two-component system, chemotaxis family, CheB/CheR fusion protein